MNLGNREVRENYLYLWGKSHRSGRYPRRTGSKGHRTPSFPPNKILDTQMKSVEFVSIGNWAIEIE